VVWDETHQQFGWDYQPIIDPKLQKIANKILHQIGEPAERGYHTEINLNIKPWLQSVADFLQAGLVLLIDYGYPRQEYYQPARHMGTLRCHYQHLAHANPFFYPGLQDITAHVDFTSVAEAAYAANLKVAGYTTQANFLMASGLIEMAADPDAPVTEQLKVAQQIKTLTLPNEMGENFKVMALTKLHDQALMGFKLRDLRHQL
jgi:SAM-dependent MidA family methyltransferase